MAFIGHESPPPFAGCHARIVGRVEPLLNSTANPVRCNGPSKKEEKGSCPCRPLVVLNATDT